MMPKPVIPLTHYVSAHKLLMAALVCLFAVSLKPVRTQSLSFDRERGQAMLSEIKNDLKKNYYDASFRGVDIDARFHQAEEEIKKAASLGQIKSIIAQALLDLDDSHTFFLPPAQTNRVDYGWQMQMIGTNCYVVAVKPGSDAEAKGLKAGDRVLSINKFTPTREDLWKMKYFYNLLSPQTGLSLVVQSPGGQPRPLDVAAKLKTGKVLVGESTSDWVDLEREYINSQRLNSHRYVEMGEELFIWRMPAFDLEEAQVDEMMGKARKRRALVLDLRGNSGGREDTMLRLIGHFFDHDVKVGDIKTRKEMRPLIAISRGSQFFSGQLFVLTDSETGSAAEVFARVMQLEKRGMVIGDRTAGAVMRSRLYSHKLGADTAIFFAASITDADLIMNDGKSLERTGVVPDKLLIPVGANLAAGRDPVLPYAASLVGVSIDPAKAASLFPFEWGTN
jgi:C-terminal processing protease CtpA/Prc